jgi:hypothetical protein
MKRKILFSIVGIALVAVAIGYSLNKNQQIKNQQQTSLQIKNKEALAQTPEGLRGPCGGVLVCDDNGQFCYLDCEWHEGWKP